MRYLFLLVLLLTACAHYHDEFHIDRLNVIYEDDLGYDCPKKSEACYNPETHTIYAHFGDWYSVGHEVCHATYGDFYHSNECRLPWRD